MSLGKGQITEFTQAIKQHHDHISRMPMIMKEISFLEHKVRIIAFLEYVFACDKDARNISFDRITERCQVEADQVELLVMKAMSLDLVRGTIDEVDRTVNIEWILPRYLASEHLKVMERRLDAWGSKMEQIIALVENGAQDLL